MKQEKNISSIPYLEIMKRAFWMTWKNHYLWWMGIFLALSSFGQIFNFSSQEKKTSQDLENFGRFFSANSSWIVPIMIFLFLLVLLLAVLGTFARAGIIRSVEKIKNKESFSFLEGMREGKKYFWKFFYLGVILSISIAIIIIVIAAPVAALFLVKSYVIGGILAFFALLILIPLLVIFCFLRIYGQIYLISSNLSLKDSLENSYRLFLKNILSSIFLVILFFLLNTLVFLGIIFWAIILIMPFGILGVIFFLILKNIGILIILSLGLLVFMAGVLFILSIYRAFSQIVWVLFFEEIARPRVEETLEEIAQEETTLPKSEPAGGIAPSEID